MIDNHFSFVELFMKIIFLVIIVGVLLLGLLGKWTCMRPFKSRKSICDDELYTMFQFENSIDFTLWKRLIHLIGECYSIQVEKLRPDDSFYGNLARLDSWNFGDGAEKLTECLQKDLGITLKQSDLKKIVTVQNLIEFCSQKNILENNHGGESGSGLNICDK